jgi:hypothetical protein
VRTRFILGCALLAGALLAGCGSESKVEEPPVKDHKVIMVPSHKEGAPASTTPVDPNAAKAPAMAPGSRPDGPQPGDLDYKGN